MKLTVLIFSLMAFASTNTGLPTPEREPIVKKLSSEQIWYLVHNEEYDPDQTHQVLATYDNGFIYLNHNFDPSDLKDTGILLHEVVHYMQDMSEKSYACNGNMEHEAHQVQFDYYRAAGIEDPIEYVGMNTMFYRLKIQCHPARQGIR